MLVLLQHVDALGGGGLVEAPHVVVHLRETLLHVILGAALPHRPKPEAQGGMVQLRRWERKGKEGRGSSLWRSRSRHPRPELPVGVGDLESDNPLAKHSNLRSLTRPCATLDCMHVHRVGA